MRIAHITDGMTSSVYADLELSRRLREAGHEVVFLSPATIGDAIGAEGMDFHQLAGDQRFLRASSSSGWSTAGNPRQFLSDVIERRALRAASIDNDEVERTIGALAPDVLLLDFELHHARIVTAGLGIPTVLTSVFFSVFRLPGLPPLDSTTRPDNVSQRSLSREWRKNMAVSRGLEWRQRAIRTARADWHRPARYQSMDIDTLRQLARSRGQDLSSLADRSNWQRPFTHRNLPFLSFNLAEMELPHQPPPNVHYVGPMVSLDRQEASVGKADRLRWAAFSDIRNSARPLIYCSLGTHWSADLSLLQRVVEVFERRPAWDLVIGMGGTASSASLGVLPPNVLALDYAPQVEVLRNAACAITHGGATSIAEFVVLAVPMVVYSTGHVDQNGNAVRVEVHQLGVRGKATDSAAVIENNVMRVLDDDSYRQRLAGLQDLAEIRRLDAVKVIEAQPASHR